MRRDQRVGAKPHHARTLTSTRSDRKMNSKLVLLISPRRVGFKGSLVDPYGGEPV